MDWWKAGRIPQMGYLWCCLGIAMSSELPRPPTGEVRRITLLRGWVNRGQEKSRSGREGGLLRRWVTRFVTAGCAGRKGAPRPGREGHAPVDAFRVDRRGFGARGGPGRPRRSRHADRRGLVRLRRGRGPHRERGDGPLQGPGLPGDRVAGRRRGGAGGRLPRRLGFGAPLKLRQGVAYVAQKAALALPPVALLLGLLGLGLGLPGPLPLLGLCFGLSLQGAALGLFGLVAHQGAVGLLDLALRLLQRYLLPWWFAFS